MNKEEVHGLLTAYQLFVDKFMSHTHTHAGEHTAAQVWPLPVATCPICCPNPSFQECIGKSVCLCMRACVRINMSLSHNFVQSSQVLMWYLRNGEMFTLPHCSVYTHTHILSNLISHVDVLLISHRSNGMFTCWGIAPCDQCLRSHKHLHDVDADRCPLSKWTMSTVYHLQQIKEWKVSQGHLAIWTI